MTTTTPRPDPPVPEPPGGYVLGRTREEHDRLRRLETELDQCWDLLRQRRALRETGGDPREASTRPPDQVEDYLN